MDQDVLVRPDIELGRELVRGLERAGVPIDAALWLQDDETGIWHLVLSSPLVASRGPRSIYEEIWKLLRELDDADLRGPEISVVGPHSRLIRELKERVRTGDELQDIRFDELHIAGNKYRSSRIYRMAGGKIGPHARVRVKSSGRLGTVQGLIKTDADPHYLVVYDLTTDDLKRVGIDLHPPIGDEIAADDLELLYITRVGRWPEKLPQVTRLAS